MHEMWGQDRLQENTFFFLDSDDYVDSRLIEKAVAAAEKFGSIRL